MLAYIFIGGPISSCFDGNTEDGDEVFAPGRTLKREEGQDKGCGITIRKEISSKLGPGC